MNLEWMDPYLKAELPKIRRQVQRLCQRRRQPHLADDVLAHALMRACERNDYDPRKAAFSTYIIMLAKGRLGEILSGKYLEHRYREDYYGGNFELDAFGNTEHGGKRGGGNYDPVDHCDPGFRAVFSRGCERLLVTFENPFDKVEWYPVWLGDLVDSLDERELKALRVVLYYAKIGRKLTYARLGRKLGVSPPTAGKVLSSLQSKVREAQERCTKASSDHSKCCTERGQTS